jgi:hypothetical protein
VPVGRIIWQGMRETVLSRKFFDRDFVTTSAASEMVSSWDHLALLIIWHFDKNIGVVMSGGSVLDAGPSNSRRETWG